MNKFDGKAGFNSISASIKSDKHKLPDIWENRGLKCEKTLGTVMKGVDIVGYGVTIYQNTTDNCYNSKTEEWEFDTKSIGDSVTDSAIDFAAEEGVQWACTAIGTALIPIPVVGTAVGYFVGTLFSKGLKKELPFWEPPKLLVDCAKDGVKDVTHFVCDKLSRIFW